MSEPPSYPDDSPHRTGSGLRPGEDPGSRSAARGESRETPPSASADDADSPDPFAKGQQFDTTVPDARPAFPSEHRPGQRGSMSQGMTGSREGTVQRRRVLPIILATLTAISTFWVGTTHWQPVLTLSQLASPDPADLMPVRRLILAHWDQGLIYMGCVMAILLFHEFGHFFATVLYRVPASFPIFLPFPFNPIGTFGAVIGMHGMHADRRQIFDIGLAGPLAGLVIAIPVMLAGVWQLDVTGRAAGDLQINCPLGVVWMIQWLRPELAVEDGYIWLSHANPYFVAGWVGFLITGLNMMPISQLDGGHVAYTLLGKRAHWVARLIIVAAIAFMVYHLAPTLILMTILLLLVGTDHPPTRNDSVPLGGFRIALGWASLVIPILCFPPFIFRIV